MPRVGTLLHYDVNDAAESTAMFGLNAGVLNFDLIDEVKGHAGAGIAADQVGGFLAFHEIGIFRVGSTGNRETVITAVGGAPWRGAAAAIAWIPAGGGVAKQGLVAGGRSELNHRLEAAPVGDRFNDIFGDVGRSDVGGDINLRSGATNLNDGFRTPDLHVEVHGRQATNFESDFALGGGETLGGYSDGVSVGRKIRESVVAARVSFDALGADQAIGGHRYGCSWNDSSGRIPKRSLQATGCFLSR